MKKTSRAVLTTLLCLVIIIAIPWSILKGQEKGRLYKKVGIDVDCEVVKVISTGRSQQVSVIYINKYGTESTATAIMNKRVSVGYEFKGKVLPSKPNEVYVEPSWILMLILYIVVGFVIILCLIGIFACLSYLIEHHILMKKGLPTKGEVINYKKLDKDYYADIRFVTNEGVEYIQTDNFVKGMPFIGQQYNLLYYPRRNGKFYFELIVFN